MLKLELVLGVTTRVTAMNVHIRKATADDVPRLREIIEASVRGLQAQDYSAAQIKGALKSVYGVDSQLIADGTYLVAEIVDPHNQLEIVACGGWSKRKTLYGAINTSRAKIRCSTPPAMLRRFARSLYIRTGRVAASAA